MRMRKLHIAVLVLLAAGALFGQATRVRGRVMDSSGSVMPGAQVKVYQGDKVVKEGVSSATGDFDILVEPGEYKLEIAAPDFDTHIELVKVTSELGPLSVTMELAQIATEVQVTEERNQISIDSDSSLTTTVLGREFIEQLPDDEDELAAYLQQIAGSRGGAGRGGSFVIDGFTGGRIPPKDQIQEIRINNSPFSSEFSGIGFGRTEIVTRAGTGDFRGQMNFQFRDESLNARNPFNVVDGAAAKRPPYQARNFNTNFSGPLIRNKLTLNLQARHNDNENSTIVRATLVDPATGSLKQLYDPVKVPNSNRGMNARTQFSINKNNTLYTNFNYQKQENRNQGVSDFTLLSRASDRTSRNVEFQFRETAILNSKMVHESRFQFSRDRSQTMPQTSGVAVNVLDMFNGGGGQNRSSNRNNETEFGNMLMYSGSKWTFKIGSQNVVRNNHSISESNFIGTWTFSNLADYLAGRPLQFTRNSGNPNLDVSQFEFATFMQNDFRLSNNFSLSFGVRYEDQTNISDHNNFDPRMGFAWQLGKTTALRGGGGMFHQRFSQNNVEQLLRLDGTRQLQIIVRNPTTYPDIPQSSTLPPASLRVRAADLATPYEMNASLSLEQSLGRDLGMTVSWDAQRGVHLYRSRNINAPLPGTSVRPDPTKGNVNQLESTGFSNSNNLSVSFRTQIRGRLNGFFFGSYTLGYTRNDTDGAFNLPMNNFDLRSEWARSGQDTRHRFQSGGQLRLPWGISTMTQVQWSSSRPYNITTGRDDNFDTNINDRPTDIALCQFWQGPNCGSLSGKAIERNSGKGPGQFNVTMGFQKTVALRSAESPAPGSAGNTGANTFAQPQRGGGGGGGFPGGGFPGGDGGPRGDFPGGGRGQRGDFPGGGRGQRGGQEGRGNNQNFNQRGPTVTFQFQVQNLLNHTQFTNYLGTMTSDYFGKANNARNARQVEAGLRFNF